MWTPVSAAKEMEIILQPLIILPAADGRADFLVERLDADLELQRARRELGDDFAQRFGQPVGNHLEVEKMPGLVPLQKEFEDGLAGSDVEIERAVHELELLHAAVQQLLQLVEQSRPAEPAAPECRATTGKTRT